MNVLGVSKDEPLATGFLILHFQMIKKYIELTAEFFKSFPVDTIAAARTLDGAIDQPGVF